MIEKDPQSDQCEDPALELFARWCNLDDAARSEFLQRIRSRDAALHAPVWAVVRAVLEADQGMYLSGDALLDAMILFRPAFRLSWNSTSERCCMRRLRPGVSTIKPIKRVYR